MFPNFGQMAQKQQHIAQLCTMVAAGEEPAAIRALVGRTALVKGGFAQQIISCCAGINTFTQI